MARICGVGQPAVWKWLQSGKRLPAEHVLTVERDTGVSRHHLRPDIYPAEQKPSPFDAGDEGFVARSAPIVPCDRVSLLQRNAA
ncbi:helix-turn-helix domain-containing protein [Sphingomonas sp. QA11]|uniref:transcriptional regulator n=1 Tax=Sphingomonas sp. QA11 TaxID=2950605 RepID=UPI00234ABE0A|nr:YdaS family helix-turn-helix protein [Sphingomonas sp. QA11]WCM29821.1 helix-turn-helix domain-containing protein [Sphingomonas sp. QA11]